MVIVVFHHSSQALVYRSMIADIILHKKDTKTVSFHLLCYLVLIYQCIISKNVTYGCQDIEIQVERVFFMED